MTVDWTQLPPELIETISKSITVYADYLHSRAVCRTWRSSIPKNPYHLPPQLPWLMLPQSQYNQSHRAFFNLSTNKFHFLNLPEASHRNRHCGSSHGWLIILDDSPLVLLINPLTRAKFSLPPLTSFPNVVSFNYSDIGREYALQNSSGDRYTRSLRQMRDWFIKKVVLSSSPLKASNFVAMTILNQTGDLAYCRNGNQSWTIIENARSFCEDVVCFNGFFYAVNKSGQIAICDVTSDSPEVSFIETPRQAGGDMQYLVSSADELLLVTRYLDLEFEVDHPDRQQYIMYRTIRFEVFRLDWSGPRWVRVRSLGDKVLFIGENTSLSLSATDFSGCMGNCIYYTDDYSDTNYDGHFGEHDLGIFKLLDGSIEPLPCYPRNFHSRLRWPPPLWVSPNPC
ncbi:hypothetical protein P3X46_020719 [Hevea brasiliensis]|uniref:KIB1-4 beta-propeller domain-containing protein n=1 Tax=Hevea brasiliensis TaxID=3981 RepID=A0ABQ9LD95_HEVBR|nr:F-box protein SKIP23 [Hevea brasiliensis]XP_021641340.2 F-box protein SKIP23 [Hevea brasiliensis]KAJ9165904.1 hypothetical protein P3X46_020719 [Hevea brasiliensis]